MKFLCALLSLACRAALPVWIDTDPSVARGGKEVDDGIALVQAFHSPELQIRGVSVVFGNAPLAQAWPIAQTLIAQYAPPGTPLHKGAASPAELGSETDATKALAQALKKEKLTLIVLGPATNIATLLRLHPELKPQITQIIAVAGRRPNQHFQLPPQGKSFRDLNFELDPAAFQLILDAKVPLVLAPWEISSKVWIEPADLKNLETANPKLKPLLEAATDWLNFWQKNFQAKGFNPFDALAVGYAISAKGFECHRVKLEIVQLPNDIPPDTKNKPYLLRRPPQPADKNLYCHQAPANFKQDLLARLIK